MKQAIILIHGVGEQVPMDTLRGFVEAVWTTDPSVIGPGRTNQVWSKPDEISRNFELRRLTTAENTRGQRTDFFEYYWTDLMADTKLAQVAAWVWVLLLRSPRRIPGQLRGLWWAVWVLGLGVLALCSIIFSNGGRSRRDCGGTVAGVVLDLFEAARRADHHQIVQPPSTTRL